MRGDGGGGWRSASPHLTRIPPPPTHTHTALTQKLNKPATTGSSRSLTPSPRSALTHITNKQTNERTNKPSFPWVLADYTSPVLDLADPRSYRDLAKPMGAVNEERWREFEERCVLC
jgi:hypothetical protein